MEVPVALDELALPPDILLAVVAVRIKRDALDPDDPRRTTMDLFLAECPLALRGETRLNLCAAPVPKAPSTTAVTACYLSAHLASVSGSCRNRRADHLATTT